jgi:hypothetical protein
VSLFDYDYDELANQLQNGLERIAVNFLRSHGARVHNDTIDFHGIERIDLELEYAGHSIKVHQVGRPRGPGYDARPEMGPGEEFETLFDGWPTENTGPEVIASWLASLPVGEAPPERESRRPASNNPFAAERSSKRRGDPVDPGRNPFLSEQSSGVEPNPFAVDDAERRRQEMLRRLRGDD